MNQPENAEKQRSRTTPTPKRRNVAAFWSDGDNLELYTHACSHGHTYTYTHSRVCELVRSKNNTTHAHNVCADTVSKWILSRTKRACVCDILQIRDFLAMCHVRLAVRRLWPGDGAEGRIKNKQLRPMCIYRSYSMK